MPYTDVQIHQYHWVIRWQNSEMGIFSRKQVMHFYFSLKSPFSYFEKDGGYTEIFTEDNVINGIIYSVKPITKGWINWSCLA